MADDGDPRLVQVRVGDEVIDHAVNAPGPGGDGPPVVRPGTGRAELGDVRLDALAHVLAVRVDVAAVEGGDGVAAGHRLVQRPGVHGRAAAGVGRAVALLAGAGSAPPHPSPGDQ